MNSNNWTPAKIVFAVFAWGSGALLIVSELASKAHGG